MARQHGKPNESLWQKIPAEQIAVPAGYAYLDARATEKELEITIKVMSPLKCCSLCETGKGLLVKNGTAELRLRDAPQGNRRCTLVIIRQRYTCKDDAHHFPSDPLPGIEDGHGWTQRLTRHLRGFANRTNLDNAAETGLSDKSVAIIHAEHAAEIDGRQKHLGKYWAVGLDEKYIYGIACFVFVDLVAREYIDLLKDNSLTTIESSLLLYQHRDLVEIVVIDMNNSYAEVAARLFPNACIIYDFFHVVAMAAECREDVRIAAWRLANANDRPLFSDRKAFWKRFDNCEDWIGQQGLLFEDQYPPVLHAYKHYRLFLDLLRSSTDPIDAACRFDFWVASMPPRLEPYFRKVVNAIEQRRDGVFGYFLEGATNGPTEAVNRNIQSEVDKGRGYGFRGLNERMKCKAEIKRQRARDLLNSGTVGPADNAGYSSDLSIEASLKRTERMRAKCKKRFN